MEGDGFLTDILLNGEDAGVASTEDHTIPTTQISHSEVQQTSQVAVQRDRRGHKI
jgi:hypothetical protein